MTNNYIQFTFLAIARPVAELYGLGSTTLVNLCCFVHFILAPFGTLLAMRLFKSFKLGHILRVAITLQFIGSLFRMYAFENGQFWPFLVGHTVYAMPGPIFLTQATIFSNRWFPD